MVMLWCTEHLASPVFGLLIIENVREARQSTAHLKVNSKIQDDQNGFQITAQGKVNDDLGVVLLVIKCTNRTWRIATPSSAGRTSVSPFTAGLSSLVSPVCSVMLPRFSENALAPCGAHPRGAIRRSLASRVGRTLSLPFRSWPFLYNGNRQKVPLPSSLESA